MDTNLSHEFIIYFSSNDTSTDHDGDMQQILNDNMRNEYEIRRRI